VIDKDGGESEYTATASVTNVAPTVHSLAMPSAPVAINTPMTVVATFSDMGTGDSHTGTFELGAGGPTANATVIENNGTGSVSASVTFSQPGVYVITANVSDDDGASGSRSSANETPNSIVVYDPTAGSVAGLGAFNSPVGALVGNPSAGGKAAFGFGAKYINGGTTLAAHLELAIRNANFHFRSTSDESLIITLGQARYRGEGTVNGSGSYGFQVTALDGGFIGVGWDRLTTNDRIRIRIWDKGTGAVVYDNQPGAPETSDAASALSLGGIVVLNR
jgi:hypothetical protein